MADWYMFTHPYTKYHWNQFLKYIEDNDIHKWIIAKEIGKNGYKHIQGRIRTNDGFVDLHKRFPLGHFEECSPNTTYEAKDGHYLTGEDWGDRRKQRFYNLRNEQKRAIEELEGTNDRQILCWYDSVGNSGKSWLCAHLWETGKAYFIQLDDGNGSSIKKDIANEYIEHGWRPYVIIDLGREVKWTRSLYEIIEKVKDGLLKDPRYNSKSINIHGVKVMVMCNHMPKLDGLSEDRWVFHQNAEALP